MRSPLNPIGARDDPDASGDGAILGAIIQGHPSHATLRPHGYGHGGVLSSLQNSPVSL